MIQRDRVLAIGSAYVEGKINSADLKLPPDRSKLSDFLDSHTEATLYAGGSVPNILTSFTRHSGNPNIKLLSCVGNDNRGTFYRNNMHPGMGEPQVTNKRSTDIWVGIYNEGLVEGMDLYGAVIDLSLSRDILEEQKNGVLMTDVDVCKLPSVPEQIRKSLDVLEDRGVFALSLVGTGHKEDIQQVLSFSPRQPDLVFGNARELRSISGEGDLDEGVRRVFPSSRLVVVTNAENGAKIRLNGEVFDVPAIQISQQRVIDETGAGDTFMGTMLSSLFRDRPVDWREPHIRKSAALAAYASGLVIQSMHSRLTPEMAKQVNDFESRKYGS